MLVYWLCKYRETGFKCLPGVFFPSWANLQMLRLGLGAQVESMRREDSGLASVRTSRMYLVDLAGASLHGQHQGCSSSLVQKTRARSQNPGLLCFGMLGLLATVPGRPSGVQPMAPKAAARGFAQHVFRSLTSGVHACLVPGPHGPARTGRMGSAAGQVEMMKPLGNDQVVADAVAHPLTATCT